MTDLGVFAAKFLKNKFTEYYPTKKIHYIEYNKRFINHQKWLWEENQLIKLHSILLGLPMVLIIFNSSRLYSDSESFPELSL